MRSFLRRAVGIFLIGLFLVGFIGLAATETFVNKTGHDVYGIRVTFSTKVTIIRHDYVFPDQDPASGRSVEFTFSGGKLHKFKRFTIVWIPGTAEVVDYEWLEEEPTASSEVEETAPPQETSSSSAPSLPDPNTPPLLYGDDYPGPDEPLYQPQPDEQIWLTDLEGHEDVYDNDGVKINFAPGFDRSKITEIKWYRNGTHLSWLDGKTEITNAEMKTFKGDEVIWTIEGWHRKAIVASPPSSHTDHAIMGYEYTAAIFFGKYDEERLSVTVKSGFRWRPKEIWLHLNSVWMTTSRRVTVNEIIDFLEFIKSEGFTGISFEMHYYIDSPYANTVKILDHYDTSIIQWGAYTASNVDLERILKAINKVGLEVNVIVQLYISQNTKISTE